MMYFRIVRSERREDGIWLLLSPNGLEVRNAPVAMMDSVNYTATRNDTMPGIFWVPQADVVAHEGTPRPTTDEDYGRYLREGFPQ